MASAAATSAISPACSFEQVERHLQVGAGGRRSLLCRDERGTPVAVEPQLDTQMLRGEQREHLALARIGGVMVAILAEPDRRNHGFRRSADRQARAAGRWRPGRNVDRFDDKTLSERLTRLERRWRAQADRRGVRLEVRVGPVSVVFGLPQVALEVEDETTPFRELHLEMIERGKEWRERLAVEGLRADQVRKRAIDLAVGSTRSEPGTGRLAPRVMDAQADAPERERGPRVPVEDVLDPTRVRPGDRAVPGEVDLAACVADVELDAEAVIRLLDLQPRDGAGNGVPVDVAHGRIYAANELGAADSEVPQVDAVEQHGGRARAQETHLGEGRVRPVQEP